MKINSTKMFEYYNDYIPCNCGDCRYFNKTSPKNYINIAKKNNFTYFDMGKYYYVVSKKNIAYKINELFIKEQHSLGKIFYKTSLDVGRVYKWELEILRGLGAIAVPF